MRILYGIQTTGNGHINRSTKIIRELRKLGIEIDILTSGGANNIVLPFDTNYKFKGAELKYNDNKVSIIKTIFGFNILNFIKDTLSIKTKYDLVISDFEPISALYARINNIKSISISNQASFRSNKIKLSGGWLSKLFINWFARCEYNIGISYSIKDDFIYYPIISDGLIDKKRMDDGYYVIYLPQIKTEDILKVLPINNRFEIFCNDTIKTNKNIKLTKISKQVFQDALLNCKGVITSSGFSTTSEALYLNKKLWSIPIKSQWEQESNAIMLKELGVFVADFNTENIKLWINEYKPVKWRWFDPTQSIIKKIFEIYGTN
jgi:uncharacterized protein (TIGR00661 family)